MTMHLTQFPAHDMIPGADQDTLQQALTPALMNAYHQLNRGMGDLDFNFSPGPGRPCPLEALLRSRAPYTEVADLIDAHAADGSAQSRTMLPAALTLYAADLLSLALPLSDGMPAQLRNGQVKVTRLRASIWGTPGGAKPPVVPGPDVSEAAALASNAVFTAAHPGTFRRFPRGVWNEVRQALLHAGSVATPSAQRERATCEILTLMLRRYLTPGFLRG